jgi:hypothetical protein
MERKVPDLQGTNTCALSVEPHLHCFFFQEADMTQPGHIYTVLAGGQQYRVTFELGRRTFELQTTVAHGLLSVEGQAFCNTLSRPFPEAAFQRWGKGYSKVLY